MTDIATISALAEQLTAKAKELTDQAAAHAAATAQSTTAKAAE